MRKSNSFKGMRGWTEVQGWIFYRRGDFPTEQLKQKIGWKKR